MAKETQKSLYNGELDLNGFKISCAVLEDGTRVLVNRSLSNALGIKGGGTYWLKKKEGGAVLPEYLSAKYLSPFISDELRQIASNPIPYINNNNILTEGIQAEFLSDICDVYVKAGENGALPDNQRIAENAYSILLAFSKVGIIALVDEATGYQYEREKDALQVLLKAYISEELLKWQKKFPDTFYYEIFRLNGWDYTVSGIAKRPGVIGRWTNELIYNQLPKGVLEELKIRTPKSTAGNYTARFFQSLTPDVGHPALTAQIYKVIGIMNVSNNWNEFKINFNKMVDRQHGQLELDFDKIEKEIDLPTTKLSSHNKALQTALEFNPKEKEPSK